ncbi:MAG: hypothetical protein ABEI99_08920, partial [Halobaculum sp.]
MTEAAWQALGEPEQFRPGEREFYEKLDTDRDEIEEHVRRAFPDGQQSVELEWNVSRFDADARIVPAEET